MNKKLVFRFLGALASALIVVSVFIPFLNIQGSNISLWDIYGTTDALYLPIMIIIFGCIGIMFFSLNIKTEFAYMSTGAISFFAIMQTIDAINKQTFNYLGIGYYLLFAGAIFTGIITFLLNLGKKELDSYNSKEENIVMQESNNDFYRNDSSIQPLPVQPINDLQVKPIDSQSQLIESMNKEVSNAQVYNNYNSAPSMNSTVPTSNLNQNSIPIQNNLVQNSNNSNYYNPAYKTIPSSNSVIVPNNSLQNNRFVSSNTTTEINSAYQNFNNSLGYQNQFINTGNTSNSNYENSGYNTQYSNISQDQSKNVDIFGQPINKS